MDVAASQKKRINKDPSIIHARWLTQESAGSAWSLNHGQPEEHAPTALWSLLFMEKKQNGLCKSKHWVRHWLILSSIFGLIVMFPHFQCVWVVSFLATLFLSLPYGVAVGVGFSILVVIFKTQLWVLGIHNCCMLEGSSSNLCVFLMMNSSQSERFRNCSGHGYGCLQKPKVVQ